MKIWLLLIVMVLPFFAHAQANNNGVYNPPAWAKGIVWYQIFPERFRDGDTTNQPDRERAEGPQGWRTSAWTSDWYKRDVWENREDFYATVNNRRYGGDLQGVINKLDYLKTLGVGAIYFNPVFDAPSLHKYDAAFYHHIDRNFGPRPKEDAALFETENPGDPKTWQWSAADSLFLQLLTEAHNRNIKVVIDGVWNHTGTQFWAFKDLVQRGSSSAYKDWYVVKSFDDAATPHKNEFDYEGWWGFKGLPVFREEGGNLVQPIREHIFAVTRRWMDPNGDGDPSDGIDGWRLDVAEEIGKEWWRDWHTLVRSINPQAITVAEIWTEKAKEFIGAGMFTSVMNYRFAYAAKDFLIDGRIDTKEFVRRLQQIEQDYPQGAEHVLQNLMDSHDAPRLASLTVNRNREYDRQGHPRDSFAVRKPNAAERRLQKLVALFQISWPGAPMIYYGTEAGMWGADDPDDRKPMVWDDLQYEPESHDPFDRPRPVDGNNFDQALHAYYQGLFRLRNSEPALQKGATKIIHQDPAKKLVVFTRTWGKEKIWVIINRSGKVQQLDILKWSGGRKFKKLWGGGSASAARIQVEPLSGIILK